MTGCCPWCNADYVDGSAPCDCAEREQRASRRRARFLGAVARLGRLHAQHGVFAEPADARMYAPHREAYRRAWVAALWAAEFRQPRDHWRIAATTLPDGRWVSTVFLGIDHSLFGGPPLIFETMVFESESMSRIEMYADRHSTREQALAGHERAIRWCADNPRTVTEPGGGT